MLFARRIVLYWCYLGEVQEIKKNVQKRYQEKEMMMIQGQKHHDHKLIMIWEKLRPLHWSRLG